ncbi:MAG: hypothetical protein IT337_06415, partial [Thermomicrobiales bacterium]|nr:hypothetical protein [Thermomicrobiales bacterium]
MSEEREARRAERAERQAERTQRRSARQALREDPKARQQAEQFVNRYTSGNPAEGYDLHEAASMFDRVRGDLTPEEMRQALQA